MKSSQQLIAETAARSRQSIPRKGPQQLPLWHEHLRGLPNAMARSALFTCAHKQAPRTEFKRTKIASVAGFQLLYTGTELRQDDEDAFLQIVHFARIQPLGDVVEITGSQLLKSLGWPTSAKSYQRLRDIIERLQEGSVTIMPEENENRGFKGSLIRKVHWRGEGGEAVESSARIKWKIYLEPEIIALFGDDAYTVIDWDDRKKLGQLAKWLHSYYYSHREPFAHKTATLHQLCGSKNANMRMFKRDLKLAHESLVDIGFLESWKYKDAYDSFFVVRKPRAIK